MVSDAMVLGGRELSEPRPSPDGRWVLFGARSGGRSSLLLVPAAGGPERLLACTPPALGRALGGGCTGWLPDSTGFLYAGTGGGVWRHGLDGASTCLTQGDGRPASSPAVSPDGRRLAYVVDLAEVHVLDLATGRDEIVSGGADFVTDPAWHPDSVGLVWHAWSVPHMAWDESVAVTAAGVVAGAPGVEVQQPRFGPDGQLWAVRDDGGFLNVTRDGRPVVAEPFEHAGPTWGPGQRSYAVSPDGVHVAFTRNEGGFGRLCVAPAASGEARDVARGVHGQLGWVGSTLTALRTGARTPTQVVAYDTATWERRVLAVGPVAEWDAAGLVEPSAITFPATDGATLHARLYRPASATGGLITWVHGGPTDQWAVSFLARVARWVDRGWTVLVADHRGSTGHGRAYRDALRGRWGELDVSDVADAIGFAHGQGWGTPERTVLMGGSAGGFTALNVLVHHPSLVAGAAVAYPVTDLAAMDDSTYRFEAHYHHTLVAPADQAAHSPLVHAHRVRRPVLVLHGEADPVVPVAQSAAFAERARAAGADVELHVYEGEGHGFREPANQADEMARVAAFVARITPGTTA